MEGRGVKLKSRLAQFREEVRKEIRETLQVAATGGSVSIQPLIASPELLAGASPPEEELSEEKEDFIPLNAVNMYDAIDRIQVTYKSFDV